METWALSMCLLVDDSAPRNQSEQYIFAPPHLDRAGCGSNSLTALLPMNVFRGLNEFEGAVFGLSSVTVRQKALGTLYLILRAWYEVRIQS